MTGFRLMLVLLLSAIFMQDARCQNPSLADINGHVQTNRHEILTEYFSFLSIPNNARDSVNIRKNAQFIQSMLQKRGVSARLLEARTPGVPPAVYGEVNVPGAKETLAFYAHYDGQPVSADKWNPKLKPTTPLLLSDALEKGGEVIPFPEKGAPFGPDWRIYCRSSSDDKAGVMAIILAYDAIIRTGKRPAFNIRFFFEGEEEIGSVHLDEILEKHKSLLNADLWVIADGPIHQSGRPMLDFGVRGDVNMSLTVYGPKRPLHSGHYGNWAPNPCLALAKLLAGMKDDQGRVTVKGYYDDVIPYTDAEKKAFAAMPSVEEQMKRELGIKRTEGDRTLADAYEWPTLNINGMKCADAGEKATNQITTEATASLDLRQVPGTDHRVQVERVKQHIRDQGYHLIDRAPTDAERMQYEKIARVSTVTGGYNAQRTPLDLPVSQRVIRAVQASTDKPIVVMPTSGGSLPLFIFEKILAAKVITLCVANHDNNQHSENENLRLQNLWDVTGQLAGIMLMK